MCTWIRRIVLAVLALFMLSVATGVAYEQWSRWSAARAYPPPGELVEVGGKLSHLNCTGEGAPTVVLESGWSIGGSLDWVRVQPAIAGLTRVCSYDRAGILWSEARRGPRDATRSVEELHALLRAASEAPPFVIVGHSLGGALARVFASRFRDEVVGLVLVDSSHPEQETRVPEHLRASLPPLPSPIGMKVRAATGIYRLRTNHPGYGLPAEVDEPVWRFGPKSMGALADEAAATADILRQAGEAGVLNDLPVVVLTASFHATSGMSQAAIVEYQDTVLALHAELAALSTNSTHRTIEHSHHYIQLEAPEAVVAAVRDVLAAVRDGTRLGAEAGSPRLP